MKKKKQKRTGLVCVVEPVPAGHQVGIAWTHNAEGLQAGFAYDEDETPRDEVPARVQAFCDENGFGIARHLEGGDWFEGAFVEEVNQDVFLDWFGGKPASAGLFFDSWGMPDDFVKVYGVPGDFDWSAMKGYRQKSAKAGVKAGFAGAGVFAAGVLVFAACAFLIAGDQPPAVAAYTLASVGLMVLGGILLVSEGQNIIRYFYRKFL